MDSDASVRAARGRIWSPHHVVVLPSGPGMCLVEIRGVLNNLIKDGTMALNQSSANGWDEALQIADGDQYLAQRVREAVGEARIAAIARAACS
jgi:hypothetical protein